jgi:hypothetical protein
MIDYLSVTYQENYATMATGMTMCVVKQISLMCYIKPDQRGEAV